MSKQVKAVSAPLGTSFTQSDAFPHLFGMVKQGKTLLPVYAPLGQRLTGQQLSTARITANVAVVTQFFTVTPMTDDEKLEFTSSNKWGLKQDEKRAFEALTTVYLSLGSGAYIEAANKWYLENKAKRATETTLVSLASRLAGYFKHNGKPLPSQLESYFKRFESGEKVRAASGKKVAPATSGVALKPSEMSLINAAYEAAKQASLQLDLLNNGKVSKAQKDALTAKLREVIAKLETVTAK